MTIGDKSTTESLTHVQGQCGGGCHKGRTHAGRVTKLHDVHSNQIVDWKNQLLTRAAGVFGANTAMAPAVDLTELHAKIGRLALENDFLAGALDKVGLSSANR